MSIEDKLTHRLDNQIGFLLRRAYQIARANFAKRLDDYDLTAVQYSALARLWERGSLSQNRLGRLVDMERAAIHTQVKRLEQKGLVRLESDPGDGRLTIVSLTKEGQSLIVNLLPLSETASKETLAGLTDKVQNELTRLLRRLIGR